MSTVGLAEVICVGNVFQFWSENGPTTLPPPSAARDSNLTWLALNAAARGNASPTATESPRNSTLDKLGPADAAVEADAVLTNAWGAAVWPGQAVASISTPARPKER